MLVYLIFGGEFSGSGGWAKYVRELTDFLTSHGYNVKIIHRLGKVSLNDVKIKLANEAGMRHRRVSLSYLASHFPNPLTVLLGTIRLVKEFKHDRDFLKVMHVHDLSSSLIITFFMWRFFRVPYIVQIHGFPLREWKIKLLQTNSFLGKLMWLLTKILHIIFVKLVMNSSALVLVNNNEVKSFYKSCGISLHKLEVMPSAINLQEHEKRLLPRSKARKYLGLTELDDISLGYIGGLRPEKNLETLINAFREFISCTEAKARLIIIGDGPLKSKLEKLVKEQGIDSYTYFFGYIPDAYRFLNGIDVFVLPSLSEGSPLSLIEAMVAGKAIIASNIPAIREIVEDGKEALLFDPHNPQQLKNLILTLYNNPKLREKLGENARRKIKQYDVDVIFSKMLQIYKRVLRSSANSN